MLVVFIASWILPFLYHLLNLIGSVQLFHHVYMYLTTSIRTYLDGVNLHNDTTKQSPTLDKGKPQKDRTKTHGLGHAYYKISMIIIHYSSVA